MSEADALVFARCAGFVSRAPGFSHPSVPAVIRAAVALALGLAVAPERGATSAGGLAFVGLLAVEAGLGACVGIAASMLYDGAYAGGRMLDDYVGIRASVPTAGISAGAGFGRLWSLAFTAGFFVFGGYALAIDEFARTFVTLPPGTLAQPAGLTVFATALPTTLVRAALFVAGPAIAAAFIVQVALAGIARIAPRFATLTLAFPIVFACVIVATIMTLPFAWPQTGRPWLDTSRLRTQISARSHAVHRP